MLSVALLLAATAVYRNQPEAKEDGEGGAVAEGVVAQSVQVLALQVAIWSLLASDKRRGVGAARLDGMAGEHRAGLDCGQRSCAGHCGSWLAADVQLPDRRTFFRSEAKEGQD